MLSAKFTALLGLTCTVTQQVIGADPCLATNISANHSSTTLLPFTKQVTRPLDYPFSSCRTRLRPSIVSPCEWRMPSRVSGTGLDPG